MMMRYKYCSAYSLPRKWLVLFPRDCSDDFPKTFLIVGFRVTFWTWDLPVMIEFP